MFAIGADIRIPPHPHAMAETVRREHGNDLTDAQVRDAITEHGWGAYAEWGNTAVSCYRAQAFEATTGQPF